MTRVVVAATDQALARELQAALGEIPDVDLAYVAASTSELVAAVTREDVDVVLVHEGLGPDPATATMRDLSLRRPATAMLLVSGDTGGDAVAQAVEAGARGVVSYPFSFESLQARFTAAAEWSGQMRRILGAGSGAGTSAEDTGAGRVVAFAGAKGGVGVTTLATHLAMDVVRTVDDVSVCLVDLDLEKGDVTGILELRHRLGVADLAKVADDLSPGTVGDAITRHPSGLDLLLAPLEVRDVEAVTPLALRQVLASLRTMYDLVLVDVGSHVTPAQATVVELAEEVVLVVTTDVAALRGMRRVINAWESLGVRKETEVRLLVNRVNRSSTVSVDTVRQLTRASLVEPSVDAGFRRLEAALNSRDPFEVRDAAWWTTLRAIGADLALVSPGAAGPGRRQARPARTRRRTGRDAAAQAGAAPASVEGAPEAPAAAPAALPAAAPGGRRRALRGDRGSVSIETIAVLPVVALLVSVAWYVGMFAITSVMQGHASQAAGREYAVTGDEGDAGVAARAAVHGFFASGTDVDASGDRVTVRMDVPFLPAMLPGVPTSLTTDRDVVVEQP
ncbi:AAA family ATPase [Aquipuribacter hungaricus]|uniref:CpaE family protein n=3 Tax=Aquipuribacter hungaricus TaxID=545624 RepID=A0ABV7WL88_9MICO